MRALPWPLDVVVLGMGTDGHTASFFPDADDLQRAARSAVRAAIVLPVHAASAGEPRLTLTLARIVDAGFIALHIEGDGQAHGASRARVAPDGDSRSAPCSTRAKPVEIFWAP